MKLTHLITLNAILFIAFGIAFALYGPLMMAFFGVPEIEENSTLLYWNVASFARLFGQPCSGSASCCGRCAASPKADHPA